MIRHLIAALVVVAAASCGGQTRSPATPRIETATDDEDAPRAAPPMTVLWDTRRIDDLGLAVDLIDGTEVRGGPAQGGGRYLQQRHDVVRLYLAWGRDVEADHRAAMAPIPGADSTESVTRVCGRDARRIVTHIPGGDDRPLGAGSARDGNPVRARGSRPARVRVELLFEHGGVPVRVVYTVESRYRSLRRGDEQHFLDSIHCYAEPSLGD